MDVIYSKYRPYIYVGIMLLILIVLLVFFGIPSPDTADNNDIDISNTFNAADELDVANITPNAFNTFNITDNTPNTFNTSNTSNSPDTSNTFNTFNITDNTLNSPNTFNTVNITDNASNTFNVANIVDELDIVNITPNDFNTFDNFNNTFNIADDISNTFETSNNTYDTFEISNNTSNNSELSGLSNTLDKGGEIDISENPLDQHVITEQNMASIPEKTRTFNVVHNNKNRITSLGEQICCDTLSKKYKVPFVSTWPNWLINPETNYGMELDCYNDKYKIAVEYNGKQHYEWPNFTNQSYVEFTNQVRRDELKRELCDQNGVYLIVVPYEVPHKEIPKFINDHLPENYVVY